MSAFPDHLIAVANEVLGNDTRHVLDCSTAFLVATVIQELAKDQETHAKTARHGAPEHAPDSYLAGYLDALDDFAIGTGELAADIERINR